MNLAELIAAARARLDDEVVTYRWSDAQLTSWANEANTEAYRRTRYGVDNTITQAITANTETYSNPDRVIFIKRAKLSTEDLPLEFKSYKDMDECVAGWETHTGTPTIIITDMITGKYILYPKPTANATLQLVGIMEPATITTASDLPARYTYSLIDWMIFRACGLRDADKESKQTALEHLALFESEFGKRSSAQDEIYNARNRPLNNYDGDY